MNVKGRILVICVTLGAAAMALSAPAYAMGWIPGNGDPRPAAGFIIVLFSLLLAGLAVSETYKRWVVGNLRRNRDVEGLINALDNPYLACCAARALGEIGDPRSEDPLIKALENRSDSVREAAAIALGKIGDERAIEPLAGLKADKYFRVRTCATSSIVSIKDRIQAGAGTGNNGGPT
ncbi:MAG TPA: HEAT repeat domain-containing protein [Methanocella sp.]|nr:HEAT repeat domain-containing protein [Methanocella sp.]